MPGPLTTVARVRELGGIDDAAAYQEFRLANDAAFVSRINTEINVASAWLQSRGGKDYASGDVVKDTLFAEAEAYLSLQNLYETLKMRKLRGVHFPYVTEESTRFESLIDVEMPEHIKKFLDAYLTVEEGKPWAAPAMVIGQVIDRTLPTYRSARQQLDVDIDEATGLPVIMFPLTTQGSNQ
jgi:hypothetical protein